MEKEKEGFSIISLREINIIFKAQYFNIVIVRVRRFQFNVFLFREGCAIYIFLRLVSFFINSVKVNIRFQKCQVFYSCFIYRFLFLFRVCVLGFQVFWESQWLQGWGLGVFSVNRFVVVFQEIVVGSNMDKIYIVMNYVEYDFKSLMEIMKQFFLLGSICRSQCQRCGFLIYVFFEMFDFQFVWVMGSIFRGGRSVDFVILIVLYCVYEGLCVQGWVCVCMRVIRGRNVFRINIF